MGMAKLLMASDRTAAARLLHEIDATGVSRIAVAPIPHTGLGEAINDRLARAAAPRHLQGRREGLRDWHEYRRRSRSAWGEA